MSPRSKKSQIIYPASAGVRFDLPASAHESHPAQNSVGQKVQRTMAKKRRVFQRTRGRLASMLDMPLDILIEVMAHLSPKDLLALARTTRSLRSYLMTRRASRFWKVARLNVEGLPECPADLSEPAYANLIFEANCHECLRKDCENIYWDCRVRLCKGCYKKLATPLPSLASCISTTGSTQELLDGISGDDIFPDLSCFLSYCKADQCYAPHVAKFKKECPAENDAIIEYVQLARDRLLAITETNCFLRDWEIQRYRLNQVRLENLRLERKKAVIAKLAELGYQPELNFMSEVDHEELANMVEVRKARVLSYGGWMNAKAAILAFMDIIRERYLEKLRMDTIKNRLEVLEELLPRWCPQYYQLDLAPYEVALRIPEIRQIIDPVSTEFDQARLEKVLEVSVPAYAESRTQSARAYFAGLVRKRIGRIGVDPATDPLSLAIGTYFRCKRDRDCGGWKRPWTQMMSHYCRCSDDDEGDSEYARVAEQVFDKHGVWRPNGFKPVVYKVARCVLLSGLDPKTATAEDMDKTDVRFVCPTHGKGQSGTYVTVHSWRSVLNDHYCEDSDCELVRVPDDQAVAAIQLETARCEAETRKRENMNTWICMWCPRRGQQKTSKAIVTKHLQTVHDISDSEDSDLLELRAYDCLYTEHQSSRLINKKLEFSDSLPKGSERDIKKHRAMFFDFDGLDDSDNVN